MTRLIKLIISLFYYTFLKCKNIILELFGIYYSPLCTVLYYHSIFDYEQENFRKQMELINRNSTVIKSNYFGDLEKSKVYNIITFDDGFENLITNAIPILSEYKFPFTIFFISSYFGKTPAWEFPGYHPDQNEKIMSIEQMKSIPSNLLTIGSHTVSHLRLTTLSKNQVHYELLSSKEQLENISGVEVDTFSLPNGEYNNHILQSGFSVGYKRIYTIEPKLAIQNSDEKLTGRVWANGNDWYLEFWLKINGAYSWLNPVFKFKKTIKNIFS